MQVNDILFSIRNAYVVYNRKTDNQFVGLKNFSYDFKKNKIYCIIGKSGSGKSTLISLFNGLHRLNYGQLILSGIDVSSNKNLNNTVSKIMKIDDHQLAHFPKIDKKDNYYIAHCDKKTNYYDFNAWLLSINNNEKMYFLKLNSFQKMKLNLPLNNQYYLFSLKQDNYQNIKSHLVNSIQELNEKNNKPLIYSQKRISKKIKNYKQLRRQIGMVSQFPEFQLFKSTVLEDASFGLRVLGTKKEAAVNKAKQELTKLRINPNLFNNSPFDLSGGQKRRVAIAGILAIDGNTLIFDEPTSGLDPSGEKEMLSIIINARREGKNIFVVTHSMNQVLEIADEILVIHNGELKAAGEPYEIFNNDEILNNTNIEKPYVIDMVNQLISTNKKYADLLKLKPRTIEQLADCIIKIKKGWK